jgi:hypothetical protein
MVTIDKVADGVWSLQRAREREAPRWNSPITS